MRESLQAIIAFLMIVLAMVAGAVWFSDKAQSGQILWILRVVCPVLAIALLVILIQMRQKRDLAPDYLSMNFGACFEQNGLLFHIATELKEDDSFWLLVYFQNKHENTCGVNISLHPQPPARLRPITANFTSGAAAFGVAKVPILDASARGQRCTWEISATVHYPHGKRKQLRFKCGKSVPTNLDMKKGRSRRFGPFLVLGLFRWKPVRTTTFQIPQRIDPNAARDAITHTTTLWKLGDPPLT